MRAWIERFMYGRYGQDNLNRFLFIFALILSLVSLLTRFAIVNSLALALLVVSIFRMFSRNAEKRARENFAYLRVTERFTHFFSHIKTRLHQRKSYRFYRCPSCKQQLRVPKGKGRIRIRCPKCQVSFEKET